MEVLTSPPMPGSDAFRKANPSLDEVLAQNTRAQRLITRSSQDNLAACTDVSLKLPDLTAPPPFTPLDQKAGEGAIIKSSSTVMRDETLMETDAILAAAPLKRPSVPPPKPARQKDLNEPCKVNDTGMKKWSNDMLMGHPGGRTSEWETVGLFICLTVQRCYRYYVSVIEN